MPRAKKSQTEVTTAEEGMTMILDTPVEKSIDEAAKVVGVAEIRLLEMFAERLELPEALGWETVPSEHESLLAEFKQQQDAFNSVRSLEPEPVAEATTQPPVPTPEPPVIEDESKPAKKSKRQSSALTKKKKDAIEKDREATQKTQQGVKQTLARLQAQEGIKDAANAGTTYLQAFQATLNQVKGQGLTVLAAEMIRDLAADSDFNPDDILQDLGIEISADTQQALMEQLAPMLGKSQEATQEVLGTAWGNGIDLQAELLKLDSLMSYEN